MKIAIIGAGAMGCRFGAALTEAGATVTLCDVWQEHVDAINKTGLQITRQGVSSYVKIPATTDARSIGSVDVVFIFTKAIHTESALEQALQIMSDTTPIVTLQNGLGSISVIERYVGARRIIAGITNYQSDLAAPGSIDLGADKSGFYAKFKALDRACESAAHELCRLFKSAGMNCEISDDIMKEIWEKLAFNNAMNLITALTKQRDGVLCQSPYGFELSELIAREVCTVAAAEGVRADYDSVIRVFERVRESSVHITSMLQDVLQSKPTEVDAICGAVIEKAAKHGIDTPYLRAVFNMVKVLEANYDNQVLHL